MYMQEETNLSTEELTPADSIFFFQLYTGVLFLYLTTEQLTSPVFNILQL